MSDWRFDQFDYLVAENTKLKELLKLKTEYIDVLSEADDLTAGFLHVHGWQYPQELLNRAKGKFGTVF